jgi:GcrA cell cycle regulator
MRGDFWTKERIGTLKRLWVQGQTAGAIAKELGGVSRGAVLGKIFRLRLGTPEKPGTKTFAKGKAGTAKARHVSAKDRPARRRGAEPQVGTPRALKRKSIFDLSNQCCRWPHGEPANKSFYFCGAPGADVLNGLPYCPLHMRRAYIVPPPQQTGKTKLATSVTPWRVISRAA